MNLAQVYCYCDQMTVEDIQGFLEDKKYDFPTVEVIINQKGTESTLSVNIDDISIKDDWNGVEVSLKLYNGTLKYCFDNEDCLFIDPEDDNLYIASDDGDLELNIQF